MTTKIPGSSTCDASSVACGFATRTPACRDLLRALAVAAEEHALAADAAQHAQAGHGVGAERGQLADLLALLPLPALERLDDDAERRGEDGHADQDDEAEHDRTTRAAPPRRRRRRRSRPQAGR